MGSQWVRPMGRYILQTSHWHTIFRSHIAGCCSFKAIFGSRIAGCCSGVTLGVIFGSNIRSHIWVPYLGATFGSHIWEPHCWLLQRSSTRSHFRSHTAEPHSSHPCSHHGSQVYLPNMALKCGS